MKVINQQVKHGSQGWVAQRTVEWNGFKLRATVDQDSYEKQSAYYLEVFSPTELKWNRVHSVDVPRWYKSLPYSGWKQGGDAGGKDLDIEMLMDELIAYGQDLLEGVTA